MLDCLRFWIVHCYVVSPRQINPVVPSYQDAERCLDYVDSTQFHFGSDDDFALLLHSVHGGTVHSPSFLDILLWIYSCWRPVGLMSFWHHIRKSKKASTCMRHTTFLCMVSISKTYTRHEACSARLRVSDQW